MAPQTITTNQVRQLITENRAEIIVGPSTHINGWNRLVASYRGKPVSYINRGGRNHWQLETVTECACVVPEQSCPACTAAARNQNPIEEVF